MYVNQYLQRDFSLDHNESDPNFQNRFIIGIIYFPSAD